MASVVLVLVVVWVALRKESVDRNYSYLFGGAQNGWSLSARRAWIEIIMFVNLRVVDGVALRKESVDRNANPGSTTLTFPGSLSARRAWIEMPDKTHQRELSQRRSPQGERG